MLTMYALIQHCTTIKIEIKYAVGIDPTSYPVWLLQKCAITKPLYSSILLEKPL